MAKSVEEILKEINPNDGDEKITISRFSKKNFSALMRAIANDPEFSIKVTNIRRGNQEIEDIMISKEFRNCIRKILEKAGMDRIESKKVMTKEFEFPNLDGLYEFFAGCLYEFISNNNRFDLLNTEDFKGSIYLKEVPESTVTKEAKRFNTGESLGMYTTTKKKHKVLVSKSSCPPWLKERRKAD